MIDEPGVIDSCQDLVPGDAVEAFYNSNLVHRARSPTRPRNWDCSGFWIP